MRTYNLVTDLETATSFALGKGGRRYTMQEIDAAERAAAGGDPAAAALLLDVDHGVDDQGARLSFEQVMARHEQLIHDCPECQAARARGEQPIRWRPDDVLERMAHGWDQRPPPTNSHARRRQRERLRRLRLGLVPDQGSGRN